MAWVFPIRNSMECNALRRGLGAALPMPKYIPLSVTQAPLQGSQPYPSLSRANVYFPVRHINIALFINYIKTMPSLGRGLETETPGVLDNLPKQLERNLKEDKKVILKQRLDKVPSIKKGFSAIYILKRQTVSLLNGLNDPIEYFRIFFTPEWLQTFAQFTNKNIAKKQSMAKNAYSGLRNRKEPINGPEIGAFISYLLIMGLEYRGTAPLYWSPYIDV